MKVQVNVSDEMVEKVDFWAKKLGISRSAFCATAIGQYVFGFEKSVELIEGYATKEVTDDEREGQ